MPNIVEIVVRGIDQTKAPFTSAITNMASLEKVAKGLIGVLGGLAAGAATGLGALTKSAIDAADEAGKAAQRAGLGVEAWSRLAAAAKLADVETKTLEGAFKAFNKTIVEAVNDPTSRAARLFHALGVSLVDAQGKLRASDLVMKDLADRFKGFEENAGKGRLAAELFGQKMGPELLPLLNQGAAAIEKIGAEANVVTAAMAAQADQYKDNVDRLKTVLASFGFTIAQQVLPNLAQFSQALADNANQQQNVEARSQVLTNLLKGFANFTIAAYYGVVNLGRVVSILVSNNLQPLFAIIEALPKAWRNFRDGIIESLTKIAEVFRTFGTLATALRQTWERDWLGAAISFDKFTKDFEASVKALGQKNKTESPFAPLWSGLKLGVSSAVEFARLQFGAILRDAEQYKKLFDAIWANPSAPARPGPISDDKPSPMLGDATDILGQIDQVNEHRETRSAETLERIRELEREMTEATLEGFARQRFQIDANFERRMETLDKLRLTEETHAELSEQIEKERSKRIIDLRIAQMQSAASLLGSLANTMASFGKKNFALYKGIATAEAIVSTAAGVARALREWQWPMSIVVGGIVAAAGAAQIAKIHSQKVAHSGLDFVPREEPYLLSRGERVIQPEANRDLTEMLEERKRGGGGFGQMLKVIVNLDGRAIANWAGQASRDGTLVIDARSVV